MSLEAVRRLAWTAIVLFIMAIVFAFNHRFAVRVPPPLGVGRNHGLPSPYYI